MDQATLQDNFLTQLSETSNTLVHVFLVNGIKLQGTIKKFDRFVLILENGSAQQMIYKHAVSTIVIASETPQKISVKSPRVVAETF